MDLSTNYLGLSLRSPIVPSASPLTGKLENIKQAEDFGAGAVVLHSLFEEQLVGEAAELNYHLTYGTESFAEALSYFPEPAQFHVGPEEYLNLVRRAKETVKIPVIASLNGSSIGGWTNYAKLIQQAGADALELNIYSLPTDMDVSGSTVEEKYLEILRLVKSAVSIPVAMKLSPFFSNLAHMSRRLVQTGAGGLVLFNRFYQPDIDLETRAVEPHVLLSTPQAMRLPMRWVAILHGRLGCSLAATGGIHTGEDVIKMTMVGANVSQLCSALLKYGMEHLRTIEREMMEWMEEHEYSSVKQMLGSVSQQNCDNPGAYERAQYMRALTTFATEQVPQGR
jgi:dihydroorotate dehydrogenase (fumarate)